METIKAADVKPGPTALSTNAQRPANLEVKSFIINVASKLCDKLATIEKIKNHPEHTGRLAQLKDYGYLYTSACLAASNNWNYDPKALLQDELAYYNLSLSDLDDKTITYATGVITCLMKVFQDKVFV